MIDQLNVALKRMQYNAIESKNDEVEWRVRWLVNNDEIKKKDGVHDRLKSL